jgi:hypothetical protein
MARVVVTIGQHPEEPDQRVIAVTKLNVTKRPLALTYSILSLPDTLKYQDRSVIEWGEFVDLTSDEIVSVAPAKKTGGKSDEAEAFLTEILDDGPMELSAIKRAAEARGVSVTTLMRAHKTMGIVKTKTGFGKDKRSIWSLPGTNHQTKTDDASSPSEL